jgi:hypothetical protein
MQQCDLAITRQHEKDLPFTFCIRHNHFPVEEWLMSCKNNRGSILVLMRLRSFDKNDLVQCHIDSFVKITQAFKEPYKSLPCLFLYSFRHLLTSIA